MHPLLTVMFAVGAFSGEETDAAAQSALNRRVPLSVEATAQTKCPDAALMARALAFAQQQMDSQWPVGFVLTLESRPPELHLALRDPAGEIVLTRRVPSAGERCDSLADAVVVVVERYFRALTPARAPPEDGFPTAAGAGAGGVAPASRGAAEGRQRPARLAVGAGLMLWTRWSRPAALVEMRGRVSGPLAVGIGVLLPTFDQRQVLVGGPGRAELVALPVVGRVGVERGRGAVSGWVACQGILSFEWAESVGIVTAATRRRTVLAAGLALGATWALTDRLRVAVDVGGYRTVLGNSLSVVGIDGPVLEPPAWQATAAVSLEGVLFR